MIKWDEIEWKQIRLNQFWSVGIMDNEVHGLQSRIWFLSRLDTGSISWSKYLQAKKDSEGYRTNDMYDKQTVLVRTSTARTLISQVKSINSPFYFPTPPLQMLLRKEFEWSTVTSRLYWFPFFFVHFSLEKFRIEINWLSHFFYIFSSH